MGDDTQPRDEYERRFERMQRAIEETRRVVDDLSSALFGDSSRLLRGHEERLQILEKAVNQLNANWAQLMARVDTLVTVGRAIVWLLGFVGVVGLANIARMVIGG